MGGERVDFVHLTTERCQQWVEVVISLLCGIVGVRERERERERGSMKIVVAVEN